MFTLSQHRIGARLLTAIPNAPGALAYVRSEFDRCWPWLEAAIRHGGDLHTPESIWNGIVTGRFQFWPYARSAGVTCVDTYPNGNVLQLWLVGGELDDVLEHEAELAAWAAAIGCIALKLVGRAGWKKALAPLGYNPGDLVLTKRIEPWDSKRQA